MARLDKVKEVYPNHDIVGIREVHYKGHGWRQVKVRKNEAKICSWIDFYSQSGVDMVSLLVRDKVSGSAKQSDFKISELI